MEKDMITDGTPREFLINVKIADICNYVNARTISDYSRDREKGSASIFTDKDKDILLSMISPHIGKIHEILARRMECAPVVTDEGIVYTLIIGDNHDDTLMNVITIRVKDYLCKAAYHEWIGKDFKDEERSLDDIRSAIHYRKHSVCKHRKCNFF